MPDRQGADFTASLKLCSQPSHENHLKSLHLTCVLGVDPSLTGTGLVVVDPLGRPLHQERVSTPASQPELDRFRVIVDRVSAARERHGPGLMVIEAPALGCRNQGTSALCGLFWLLQWETPGTACRVITVPPTSLKKFTTGKGTAKKDTMQLEIFKRWGRDFPSADEADAYALAMLGWAVARGRHSLAPGRKGKKGGASC